MLGQWPSYRLGPAGDVAAIDRAREALVLELLEHRLDRHVGQLLARPYLGHRADETDQLVARIDGLLQRSIARYLHVIGVRLYRRDYLLRPPALAHHPPADVQVSL